MALVAGVGQALRRFRRPCLEAHALGRGAMSAAVRSDLAEGLSIDRDGAICRTPGGCSRPIQAWLLERYAI